MFKINNKLKSKKGYGLIAVGMKKINTIEKSTSYDEEFIKNWKSMTIDNVKGIYDKTEKKKGDK